jgi:hypothetical protein
VVDGNGAGSEKDQGEGQGGCREGEFVSRAVGRSYKPIVQVDFPDGYRQVDPDGESGGTGEKSCENQYSAKKFGERGDIPQPCGDAEAGHHLGMVVQASENFVVAMYHHDCAQRQAHHKKSKGLQTIEITQSIPPVDEIDYLSPAPARKNWNPEND